MKSYGLNEKRAGTVRPKRNAIFSGKDRFPDV